MASVKIDFRIAGIDEVRKAFASIGVQAQRSAGQASRAQAQGQRESTAAARAAAAEQKKIAREQAADAKRINREKLAEEKKTARETAAEQKRQARETAAAQRQQSRDVLAVARATTREKEAEARKAEQTLRSWMRKTTQEQAAAERKTAREQAAATRKSARDAAKEHADKASNRREVVMGGVDGLKRGVGAVAGAAGLVTGAIGLAGVHGAVDERLQLGKINAQLAADVNEKGKDPLDQNALIKRQQGVAKSTGISALSVAEAMSVAAGEGGGAEGLETFNKELEKMGELALASGTKLEDIAKISATLTNNMVTDSKEQVAAITNLLGAAKKNNVNLRDEAEKVMMIAGAHSASNFAGTGSQRVQQSGALMQMAKLGGAGNPDDAATAGRNFYNDIASKEKQLKRLGVTTFDKKTGKRTDAVEQFIQLFEKTKGNTTKIDEIFGMQSQSIVGALSAAARGENTKLNEGAGRKLTGRDAVKRLLTESSTGGMSFEEVQKDANIVRSDTSNQMARAMEDFKAKVGNELVPVLARNIGNFATLADKVAYVTGVFAEHPGKVIAGFIGLSTALGVAQSALGVLGGSLLDRLIPKAVTSMNVAAGTVVVGGAGAAAGTAASTAASGAGTAAAGAGGGFLARNAAKAGTSVAGLLGGVGIAAVGGLAAGYGLSEWYDSTSKDRRKGTQGAINDSFGLSMKLSQGKGTAADVQKAQEVLARLDKAAKPGFVGGVDRMLGDDHAGRAGGAAKELREALAKAQVKLDPGVTLNVNITNAADIANATNAQKPKAQGID